jgi:hypothetical protein
MSRQNRERRLEAQDRWPSLTAWLVEFFGFGVFHRFDTLVAARAAAVSSLDVGRKKQMASEWWDWNSCFGTRQNLPEYLDAYGVDLDFGTDDEVRQFMNEIYDELVVAIRQQEAGWKP